MAVSSPEPVLIQIGDVSPGRRVASGTFSGNFWGEKCKGFSVLLRNLKSGSSVSGHLMDYLKERSSVEKSYVSGLQKLHKSLQQINDAHLGTFYPMWVVLMKSVEDSFGLHEQYLTQLSNVAKDVSDYASKLDDRLKQKRKGEIDNAGKSLKTFIRTMDVIAKTKKTYEHSCIEVIEQTRELEKIKRLEGAKPKDIEKQEGKLRKAKGHLEQTKTDHLKSIQHHEDMLEEYKECMAKACTKFQALEEEHLDQLTSFMTMIAYANEGRHSKLLQEAKKMKEKIGSLPIQQLINIYSQTRGTGRTKPTPYKFREVDVDAMIQASSHSDLAPIKAKKIRLKKHPKEARGVKKDQEGGKELSDRNAGTNGPVEGTPTPQEGSPEIDDEGYSIRPSDAVKVAKFSDEESSQSSSDSDFDSDDEPELRLRKIKIKDIPVRSDTNSIDDLKGAAAKLSLDAPPPSSGMKKASSSQSLKASITTSIVREPSPVGSQSLFEVLSGPPINPLPSSGSAEVSSSQQSDNFSLDVNFSLPAPLLPSSLTSSLPAPPDLVSADLSVPLPSASSSWTSFDSPLPGKSVRDSSMPNLEQPLTINWGGSDLSGLDTGASQGEEPKIEPLPAVADESDLDVISHTRSSPALTKAPSNEFKVLTKESKSPSLPGPSLLPPPSSKGSKRRSKITVSSQAPAAMVNVVPPPFAGQVPLQPTASPPLLTKMSSTSLNSQSESSPGNKATTLTADHSPSLQPTLSPVLVPQPYSPKSESHSPQGRASESSSATSFPNTPVSTSSASPVLKPQKTSGAVLSPLANVSLTSTGSQSAGGGIVIPIAVAIHETCNAIFRGNKSVVKVMGEVMFSFPLGYVSQFANHAPLRFVVSQTSMVTKLIHNQNYLSKEQDDVFVFQMDKLSVYLKQFIQNQSAHVQFCNLPVLKYDVTLSDVTKLPLQLSCLWKCDSTTTDYQLSLTYKASCLPFSPKPSLTNVTATVSVNGGVTSTQSSPSGTWSKEHSRLLWSVGEMRPAENPVPITLHSKFELSSGPSTPMPTVIQFICDGSTLSGLRLKLDTHAYKVSLYKNKSIAGKYMVEQVQET